MGMYWGWIITCVLCVIFLIITIRNIRRFIATRGDSTVRCPVIGYKRITDGKIIPSIVPMIEKDGIKYVLEGFSNTQIQKIIPPDTKILCQKNAKGIEFKSYTLLIMPLLLLLYFSFILSIVIGVSNNYYLIFPIALFFIVMIISALDYWQIYDSKFLSNIFSLQSENKKILKLSSDEYASLVANKDRILTYDEALAIAKKEEFLQLLMLIPMAVILILCFMLQSLTLL